MEKYLLVRSIFCPDYQHFKKSFRGIINTADFINFVGESVDLLVIGYTKPKYTDHIDKICGWKSGMFNNIYTKLWRINWGKYEILNYLLNFCDKYKGILFMDHDIVLPLTDKTVFNKLKSVCDGCINNRKVGFTALNQVGDCRHQPNIYENQVLIDGIHVVYPNLTNYGAIASGCFFSQPQVLKNVLPLDKISVYGLDDYYICKTLVDNGFNPVVVSSIVVEHPNDSSIIYKKWKKRMVEKCISNNVKYLETIQDATNFWNGFSRTG